MRLFSLYVDYAASAYARWATGIITKLAGPRWQFSTEMWNLDALSASEPIRKMITGDAAEADVLLIAASSLDQREAKLIEWLNSLAEWQPGRPAYGLLVGLFGDEENRSRELEWTVAQFTGCARQMGRELVVQWMEWEAMNDAAWLTERVETLLVRKQSERSKAFQPETAAGVG